MRRWILIIATLMVTCGTFVSQAAKRHGALIKMDRVSHDFGEVSRRGNTLTYTFVATNVGTAPLVITEGSTTCSCIKVKHPRRPIAPGESGDIEVRYELERKDVGTFHKVIKIFSNSYDGGCQVLVINGISK